MGRHEVFEIAVTSSTVYGNPFTETRLEAEFTGPEGQRVKLSGFYDGEGSWKARFVPDREGIWRYRAVLAGKGNAAKKSGQFRCVPSARRGFIRISKRNPYRFESPDGKLFHPLGMQFGWGIPSRPGFDGPDNKEWHAADREEVVRAFRGSVNIIRSQMGTGTSAGVAMDLFRDSPDLFSYNIGRCREVDDSCRIIRREGWAQIMTPFQDMSEWFEDTTVFGKTRDTKTYKTLKGPNLPAIEAYLRYVVARWAAYTDIWEIYNEDSYCPTEYLAHLAGIIRGADPYGHPITTNYDRPREEWCEILTPHFYFGSGMPHEAPAELVRQSAVWKSYAKPVLCTEFGNGGQPGFSNYDPVRWRVSAWTLFMQEIGVIFWNMSGRKIPPRGENEKGGNLNAYLDRETRRAFRVLLDFADGLPSTLKPTLSGWCGQGLVESFILTDGERAAVYLHNHLRPGEKVDPQGLYFAGLGQGKYRVTWIDPATDRRLAELAFNSPGTFATIPTVPFTIDAAARIERTGRE